MERYEKLFDVVCVKDDDYDVGDDLRRLRSGEIDFNLETKSAKSDAVDMDEDEKEMFVEV